VEKRLPPGDLSSKYFEKRLLLQGAFFVFHVRPFFLCRRAGCIQFCPPHDNNMNSPAAVIFDLDGTLLDTLDDLADSANEALAACGLPVHPVNAYRTFVGEGMAVLIERILPPERREPPLFQQVLQTYQSVYSRRWREKSRPYPGIVDMLLALKAKGIPLTVLSNKPQAYTEICMAHFLEGFGFEIILGQRDHVPRKPNPAGALEIAQRLSLDPSRILFIGDTATDMDTATAAGMIPVGVLWGFREEEELRAHGARYIVSDPAGIPALFPL
jgi:phosphoglycolate phosphatase